MVRGTNQIGLDEVLLLKTGAATGVGLTGEEKQLQPFRATEGVELLQQFQHGRWSQLFSAMVEAVVLCHQQGDLAVVTRYP